MSTSSSNAIRLSESAASGPLSRARKQFNNLIKKLELERANLAHWREELPKIRALAEGEFDPLVDILDAHRRNMVLILDQAYQRQKFSKKEKEKLAEIMCSVSEELLADNDSDAEIKEIYNKYSGGDYDEELEDDKILMRSMLSTITGVELDDDLDFSSPEEMLKAMHEKVLEQRQAEAEPNAEPAQPAKLSARDKRQQEQEAKLKQSVRDIFRKLASTLHPDRETDPLEHQRKTALMQRANVAYAANDLLGLLELQLEVDQIDQAGLDQLSEDRIKQYNRILDDQLNEIKTELFAMERAVAAAMGWELGARRTPKAMMKGLRADIAAMKSDIKNIEADVQSFDDVKKIKLWLKGFKLHYQPEFDEPWF